MQLYIDASGGFAGDMFAAALIGAGADEKKVVEAMLAAAQTIGRASVSHIVTADGSSRMRISVEHHHGHLSSHKAIHLLEHLFDDFKIEPLYREFGFRMLNELVNAEKIAHATHDFDMEDPNMHHHHHHGHSHAHSHDHDHTHHHHDEEHTHHHGHNEALYNQPEAWLHEAQDILIDIMGAVMGLQELQSSTNAILLAPVAYGGGSVSFSHGTMKVPAPATKVMIENNHIPVTAGPIEIELFTPTGAAALSALNAKTVGTPPNEGPKRKGKSRGTKDLPIPPLQISLF
ncbi:nickel insertion protein [Alkaliflexus imshenetskii]|uniref:nickel insertion protein n=1 Tax=Alkaliflexus imshenetskii TaxID=286730 RepID=UPI00047D1039|nr:nickel insertion protein [Alkaliflexus imshenetskii]